MRSVVKRTFFSFPTVLFIQERPNVNILEHCSRTLVKFEKIYKGFVYNRSSSTNSVNKPLDFIHLVLCNLIQNIFKTIERYLIDYERK